jgi:serine/threonine protein kinase
VPSKRIAPMLAFDAEVERSVRDRLYSRSTVVTLAPPPRAALPAGGLAGGRYRLLERIGQGATAVVHRARDERLKREVAVKVISERLAHAPPFVRRFRREAELCAGLAHPKLVAVLDAGHEPQDHIVMELVRGLDAATLMERTGRLTAAQGVHVIAQVCQGLQHAHDEGVIHHDVSPRSILIGLPDGTAKLAGFGLASDGAGRPGYVAPEILRGARPSPRSDLYSLAAVAYRLLSPDPPRALCGVLEQALAHEPDERQESVAEFRAQLIGEHATCLPAPVRAELPSAA